MIKDPSRTSNLDRAKAIRSEDRGARGKFKSSGRRLHLIEFPLSSRLLVPMPLASICASLEEKPPLAGKSDLFVNGRRYRRVVKFTMEIGFQRTGTPCIFFAKEPRISALLRPPLLLPRPLSLSLFLSLLFHARSGFRVVIRMTGFHRWRRCISTVDT